MKLSLVILNLLLLVCDIHAAPPGTLSPEARRRARREMKERGINHLTTPLVRVSEQGAILEEITDKEFVTYSNNWAGAVIISPPTGTTFVEVGGTITVPSPTLPSTATSGTYLGSAWVGIDGDTWTNSILQTGIDWTVTKSGSSSSVVYDAWYEWYPDYAYDYSGLSISAGNSLQLKVHANTATTGVTTISDLTTGTTVSHSLTGVALGGQNAEWIVEDYSSGSSLVPFANFGSIHFTNAYAILSNGQTIGVGNAQIIELETTSNKVVTTVTLPSSSEVLITYTG